MIMPSGGRSLRSLSSLVFAATLLGFALYYLAEKTGFLAEGRAYRHHLSTGRMAELATLIEAYRLIHGEYPMGESWQADLASLGLDLPLPSIDGWRNELMYVGLGQTYELVCCGADDRCTPNRSAWIGSDYDQDIVLSGGRWTQARPLRRKNRSVSLNRAPMEVGSDGISLIVEVQLKSRAEVSGTWMTLFPNKLVRWESWAPATSNSLGALTWNVPALKEGEGAKLDIRVSSSSPSHAVCFLAVLEPMRTEEDFRDNVGRWCSG
jgi:hypothetical protein